MRVDYQRLLIDSNGRDFKAVLCWSHSRFTRNEQLEAADGKRILKNNGVHLATVKEGVIDWTTDEGKFKDFISSLTDHRYSVDLGRDSLRGRAGGHARRALPRYSVDLGRDSLRGRRNTFLQGGYPFGQIPYGYDHLYINGTERRVVPRCQQTKNLRGWIHSLAVVETEAATVRRIFDLYVNHDKSLCTIAILLNDEGIPGPEIPKKRKHALVRTGPPIWTVQNVRQRLATGAYVRLSRIGNPKNKARHAHNRIEPEERLGEWPAIVERGIWDRAQAKLQDNRGQAHEGRSGALQGILRCGCCGHVLHKENPRTAVDKRGDKYRCGSKARGLPVSCHRWTCYEAEMMPVVLRELVAAVDEETLRMLEAGPGQRGKISNQEVLQAHLTSLEERIRTGADQYLDPKVSEAMRTAPEKRVGELTAEAAETRKRLEAIKVAENLGGVQHFLDWWQEVRPTLVLISKGGEGSRVADDVLIEAPGEGGNWQPVGYFVYDGDGREGAVILDPKRYIVEEESGGPAPVVADPAKLRALSSGSACRSTAFGGSLPKRSGRPGRRGGATAAPAGCPSGCWTRPGWWSRSTAVNRVTVMLGQGAVQLGIARVTVVGPAGRHQEVHDVQAEPGVAGAGLLVEQRAGGDAADVALLVDAGLQGVGVDLDVIVGLRDANVGRVGAPDRQGQKGQEQKKGEAAHGGTP